MIEKKKFLDQEILKTFNELLLSDNFSWFYAKYQTVESGGKDGGYMYHSFYKDNNVNSNFYLYMFPLIKALNIQALINMRANLTLRKQTRNYSGWHTDQGFKNPKHKTAIFYLNTNNGYTEFKNGKKINSEQNKVIIFDAKQEHRAVSQTDEDQRIVLNLNYYD